ncbi:hypothetical protein PTKIN_Ptkin09bG0031400 [Pterospermum kingtungense]
MHDGGVFMCISSVPLLLGEDPVPQSLGKWWEDCSVPVTEYCFGVEITHSELSPGFYPLRDRSTLRHSFTSLKSWLDISSDIGHASSTLDQLNVVSSKYRQGLLSNSDVTLQDVDDLEEVKQELDLLHCLFLVDEISWADNSVLERLNSVLEPERKLCLAEGGNVLEKVIAYDNRLVLAAMNPGGDYGKRELSCALHNRFTEIWVPSVGDLSELRSIASNRLSRFELSYLVNPMVNFYECSWEVPYCQRSSVLNCIFSVQLRFSYLHGAFLVLLDGLSLGLAFLQFVDDVIFSCMLPSIFVFDILSLRRVKGKMLVISIRTAKGNVDDINLYSELSKMENYGWGDLETATEIKTDSLLCDNIFSIDPFYIEKVLLEGSPGVGKTSLIVALGKFSGYKVVRINLSEQTDMVDLLGSELPVESDGGMKFSWSDGILLQALKEGCWVLLDELNLAPQSVLEGLNAILDHRAKVFIPELGRTFRCPSSFRVFACPNPSYQGGGRKGLPKSFLIRFTKFHEDTMLFHKFAQNGSSWEFNLRDVLRSCQIIQGQDVEGTAVGSFVNLIYVQRMRTAADWRQVMQLYEQIFGVKLHINPYPRVQLNSDYMIVGSVAIKRNFSRPSGNFSQLKVVPGVRCNLEAAAHCVQQGWLCILIGPPSSGKTSLIRLLAQLTGNVLYELNLSSATDISELHGCFEQYNALRNFRSVAQVGRFVNEYSSLVLETLMETFLSERKDLIARWLAFVSNVNIDLMPSSSLMCPETWNGICKSLPSLIEIIEQLKSDLEKNVLPVPWASGDLDWTMKTILKLQDHKRRPYSVKFEWVTGLLINSTDNIEWVVLENAKLCNPTVLDRINSLVEPDGTITVNECGIVDGKPVILRSHTNFRMFLTVNPSFGEVSQAMRNRGVEIFMMDPYWIFEEGRGYNSEELEMKDVMIFIVLAGIPRVELVDSMAKVHVFARVEGVNIVNHAKNAYLSVTGLYASDSSLESAPCLPGGWPVPLTLRDLAWYPKEYLKDVLCRSGCKGSNLLDWKMLCMTLYPQVSKGLRSESDEKMGFNLNIANKMMLYASNWAVEQATENDFWLYLQWFNWFSFQLEPYDQFFRSFLASIEQERRHPIWVTIIQCRQELLSLNHVDIDSHPILMLCLEFFDLTSLNHLSNASGKLLHDAILCVGLLRLSYRQWNVESRHKFTDESLRFVPFLDTLRVLEEEILNKLVGSPSFGLLYELYTNLLEDHMLFWEGLISWQSECLMISWRSLLKDAGKLKEFCPIAAKNFISHIYYCHFI